MFRLGGASGVSPWSQTGSSKPEPAADTAGEGSSDSRGEEPPGGLSQHLPRTAAHQTAADGEASAHSSTGSSRRGSAAETHGGEAHREPPAGRGHGPGRQGAGQTRGGTVSMFFYHNHC